jgi:hypothetical protein
VAATIPVLFLRERRTYIAYTPVLDLSASGTSIERAKRNFERTLHLFLEDLLERGTLDQVLRDLGWSRHDHQWQPPIHIERSVTLPFRIPAAA